MGSQERKISAFDVCVVKFAAVRGRRGLLLARSGVVGRAGFVSLVVIGRNGRRRCRSYAAHAEILANRHLSAGSRQTGRQFIGSGSSAAVIVGGAFVHLEMIRGRHYTITYSGENAVQHRRGKRISPDFKLI